MIDQPSKMELAVRRPAKGLLSLRANLVSLFCRTINAGRLVNKNAVRRSVGYLNNAHQ